MTATLARPSVVCLPRFATSRTKGRKTRGSEVAAMAERLGRPLMPWQLLVANVGLELLKDGRPAYREVVCTVPRQSGKTTLILAWEFHRAIEWGKGQSIVYTAQTGQDARQKLIEDQYDRLVRPSSVDSEVRQIRRGMADSVILFENGSILRALSTADDVGHGKTLDLAVIDEAMAHADDRMEQGLRPTMATRPDAQILVFSTAGTEKSVFLRRKVETGRQAVLDGLTTGLAYFEWSAGEDDDITDPESWRGWMPALGQTITEEVVEADRVGMSDGEWRRAYGNQWTTTDERVIPEAVWLAVCDPELDRPAGGLVFGADATPDRLSAAIVAADASGRVGLIAHEPGVGWLVERLAALAAKWSAEVVVDVSGPVGGLTESLKQRGVRVYGMQPREVGYATGNIYDRIADGEIRVRSDPSFDRAVAGAQRRAVGDGWVWARRSSDADISPLVALTLAVGRAGNKRRSVYEEREMEMTG